MNRQRIVEIVLAWQKAHYVTLAKGEADALADFLIAEINNPVCPKCGGTGHYEHKMGEYKPCDCQSASKPQKWGDIEPMSHRDFNTREQIVDKINEIIDRLNEIGKQLERAEG